MDTIFISYENSKTSDSHRLLHNPSEQKQQQEQQVLLLVIKLLNLEPKIGPTQMMTHVSNVSKR